MKKKALLKQGAGQLLRVVNNNPQKGKRVDIFLDGKLSFSRSLGHTFSVDFEEEPERAAHYTPTGGKYRDFDTNLEMETAGDVHIFYR